MSLTNTLSDYVNNFASDSIQNVSFNDNFTEDEFNSFINNNYKLSLNKLSIFHLNIRSLNANHIKLKQYLTGLALSFDIIVLSEIWDYNLQFLGNLFQNFSFIYKTPGQSKIGGIGIYINNSVNFQRLLELEMVSINSHNFEDLWLEIEVKKGNKFKKIILGAVYRHPNQSVNDFRVILEEAFNKVKNLKLPCLVCGDINVNLLKYLSHKETKDFIDNIIIQNFLPISVLPTRITETTASLIDHFYYSDGPKPLTDITISTGNLVCDISDHLANYVIISEINSKNKLCNQRPLIRLFSQENKTKFSRLLQNIDWGLHLSNFSDPNIVYEKISDMLENLFNDCFPLKQISIARHKDKQWMTASLRASSNHKNKLYKIWLNSKQKTDETIYKKYKNTFSKLCKMAELNYYRKIFDGKVVSIKKRWQHLNSYLKTKSNLQSSKNAINKIHNGISIVTEPKEICDAFNEYFCSIGKNLASQCPTLLEIL